MKGRIEDGQLWDVRAKELLSRLNGQQFEGVMLRGELRQAVDLRANPGVDQSRFGERAPAVYDSMAGDRDLVRFAQHGGRPCAESAEHPRQDLGRR